MNHDDPRALHDALLQAGTGAGRIVDDTTSALASGVAATPALFIGREHYRGELAPAAVSTAIERASGG